MKAKLMIFFCLLLLPMIIYADEGKTFALDFENKEQYNLWLQKSDRILFEYGGYNNTIIIDEIKINTTEIDMFLFLEKGPHTPDYQFLGREYELRLDLDKNGKKELGIRLINNDLKEEKTNILFKRLEGWDKESIIDLSDWKGVGEETKNTNYFRYILFGVVIIMILSLAMILLRYFYKNKEIYF